MLLIYLNSLLGVVKKIACLPFDFSGILGWRAAFILFFIERMW